MKLHKIIFLSIFGLSVLFLGACSSEKKTEAAAETPVAVQLSTPEAGNQNEITLSGQIEAAQSATISTRVMGYITSVKVKAGDKVSKGQLLVTISSDDILARRSQADAMLDQATAGYKNAEKDFNRYNTLFKQQSASAKEVDNITLQFEAAKAQLKAARQMRIEANAMLAYSNITAPFSGVVTQKMVDAGSMANPGMPLLVIEQNGNFQVKASVPETEIGRLSTDAVAVVSVKSINKTFSGKITELSPSSAGTGGLYALKINVPADAKPGLHPGMYVNIAIPVKGQSNTDNNTVMVPREAIVNRGQLTGIYTPANKNTALLRWVRLGKTTGQQVEVLSGLAKNEQFIVRAEGKLYNGSAIKIIN